MKRDEAGDAHAIYTLGLHYYNGMGFVQDHTKALEFYHRAAKLGYAGAYSNIGYVYENGISVRRDMKKAKHYYELSAIGGDETARYNLGLSEALEGNYDRAIKHYMIAIEGEESDSLQTIQKLYSKGLATKEEYTKALKLYQTYLSEIKTPQRDEAATADEDYRYY